MANFSVIEESAKARAKAIEYEAEKIYQDAKLYLKERELELRCSFEKETSKTIKKYEHLSAENDKKIAKEQQRLDNEQAKLIREQQNLESLKNQLRIDKEGFLKIQEDYKIALRAINSELCAAAQMSREEAKELLMNRLYEESHAEIAKKFRHYEQEIREQAEAKANYILSLAVSRFAGKYATERLISTINLTDDDMKARIIGKEGRNIKSLETICGVDIIVDNTPNVIIVSSHNLYRRAIAVEAIETLLADGRIHPARIEEVYEKTAQEFDKKILEEGEVVTQDLGILNMHPEVKKLIGKLRYRASYGQNALAHSLEVAHLSGMIAAELGGDCQLAIRAGLLHDIGKALTHEFKGNHVELGVEIAKRYNEHPVVINAILSHHGHEEIKSIEAAAVCAADSLSAARPGARREVLESYLKRIHKIEEIALSKVGVKQAYAINAGREIRVITQAEILNDEESTLLAFEIARDLEDQVQYPGDIKVSVIREMRACAIAQ